MSDVHPGSPSAFDDLVLLARSTGDVLLRVSHAGQVIWSSDPSVVTDTAFTELFDPRDADVAAGLLADDGRGPIAVRLAGPAIERVSAHAVSTAGGWLVQLRRPAPLTGAQALDELAWLLSATPRTGRETAVVAVDLDGFADTSHPDDVAREVLDLVARRIVGALREGDIVARLADDRFLVVLRGVHHLRGSIRVANKIRAVVEDPISTPAGPITQTASVGVTLVSLGEEVDDVLARVDSAAAAARSVGGNVVRSNPAI